MANTAYTVHKGNFSGGEISPIARGDIKDPEYPNASSLMYNLLPMQRKGVRRRPSTRYIAAPVFDSNACAEVPFTAIFGQKFCLLIGRVATVATIYVYSMQSHSATPVGTITSNVPAYALADFAAITWAQNNGQVLLFMRGTSGGTAGGQPVCSIQNASSDGSGAWSATQPSFTNTDTGGETFGATNHYPGCGEFYAGRLYLASTNSDPLTIWASQLPAPGTTATQFTVFSVTATPNAASGIFLQQNDINAPFINWLLASQSLLMATIKAAWFYPDGISGIPPTPSGFWLRKSSVFGALPFARPVQVKNVNLYLGSDAKSFRSLILFTQRGYFDDGELSAQAEHLMSRLCVAFAVTVRPDPTAWIQMADGSLVAATVRQEDNGFVVKAGCAFSQHALGGSGSLTNVMTLENTNWDELWMTVVRGSTLTLEYLYLDDINSTTQPNANYGMDCSVPLAIPTFTPTGITVQGSNVIGSVSNMTGLVLGQTVAGAGIPAGATIIGVNVAGTAITISLKATASASGVALTIVGASTYTGLPAVLNGQTCWAYGDGAVIKGAPTLPMQPSGGSVTLPSGLSLPQSVLTIGLPYYSAWQDVYPELPAHGTSQGKIKKVEKSWLRVVNSLGAYIGQVMPADPLNNPGLATGGTLAKVWGAQVFGVQKYGQPPTWQNMDVPVDHSEAAAPDGRVCIVVADPVPFNLAMISTRIGLSEA